MTLLVFILLAFGPLAVDMYYRRDGEVSLRAASIWSGVYIASAILFALFLYGWRGPSDAELFLSGWAVEKSLSLDNLAVFAAIFAYFGVQGEYRYRVLHLGIIGSVVLRLMFVASGILLFALFGRLVDVLFGLFVLWTGFKLFKSDGDEAPETIDHGNRWYVKWTKRIFPVSTVMDGRFFVRKKVAFFDSMPAVTPLFLCLIAIEFTDIAFAFDSVPVVIAISKSTVIAYSSIMFAVIGLRSLFFVVEALRKYTPGIQKGIVGVLAVIGAKLVIHGATGYALPAGIMFTVIAASFLYGILSTVKTAKSKTATVAG